MDAYGCPPLTHHLKWMHFWTSNIYTVLWQLVLTASAVVDSVTAQVSLHVLKYFSFCKFFPYI
jgi:hypothetical protein